MNHNLITELLIVGGIGCALYVLAPWALVGALLAYTTVWAFRLGGAR